MDGSVGERWSLAAPTSTSTPSPIIISIIVPILVGTIFIPILVSILVPILVKYWATGSLQSHLAGDQCEITRKTRKHLR